MNNWKFALMMFAFWVVLHSAARSQTYTGFYTGNFAGAIGADVQPASIADNLYTFDLIIAGASAYADNNYQTFTRENPFFNFDFDSFTGIIPRTQLTRYGYAATELRGPSFMLTLSPLDAFAFSARIRTYGNVDDLTPDLANAIADEFENPATFSKAFFNQSAFGTVMSWEEFDFTYAKVVQYRDEHFFKVGGTLKMLFGNGSSYVNFKSFDYTVDSSKVITIDGLNMDFGHSDNFNDVSENNFDFKPSGGLTFGLDLGLVYERRPQQKINPTFGKKNFSRTDNRKDRPYSYRLGFALLDIGRIKHTYGLTSGIADQVTIDESINIDDKFGGLNDGQELIDSLATFTNIRVQEGTYTMGLPTTFQVNFDYNLHKGFYINANAVANLKLFKLSDQTVHEISSLTISPRYENDIFGAYLPFYVNAKGRTNLGLGLRFGPLVFGVHDILPILTREDVQSAGAYIALKTFVFGNKKVKSELECKDLYDGWNSRKKKERRERKNYGDSPDLKPLDN